MSNINLRTKQQQGSSGSVGRSLPCVKSSLGLDTAPFTLHYAKVSSHRKIHITSNPSVLPFFGLLKGHWPNKSHLLNLPKPSHFLLCSSPKSSCKEDKNRGPWTVCVHVCIFGHTWTLEINTDKTGKIWVREEKKRAQRKLSEQEYREGIIAVIWVQKDL